MTKRDLLDEREFKNGVLDENPLEFDSISSFHEKEIFPEIELNPRPQIGVRNSSKLKWTKRKYTSFPVPSQRGVEVCRRVRRDL